MGDVYTLDKGKLSGRGVVAGSNWRVPPIEEAAIRFGASPGGGMAGGGADLAHAVGAMESLVAALEGALSRNQVGSIKVSPAHFGAASSL